MSKSKNGHLRASLGNDVWRLFGRQHQTLVLLPLGEIVDLEQAKTHDAETDRYGDY
jgi:hypothetical protein